jgi:HD-GYP domain-containing protein (c-di-GMP phosphodiesterase class II)
MVAPGTGKRDGQRPTPGGRAADRLGLAGVCVGSARWTHHERVDGGGYPRGLVGEEIPLEGRIAAVADVFDALTRDRVYRPRFSRERALDMLEAGRGTQFDPDVLDAFVAAELRAESSSRTRACQSNG